MRSSIRLKLFAGISAIILFIFVGLFLANSFLSRPFFIYQQKSKLKDIYTLVDNIDESNYDSVISENQEVQSTFNIELFILDEDKNVIYNSRERQNEEHENLFFLERIDSMEEDQVNEKYSIYMDVPSENTDKNSFLMLYGSLRNDDQVIIRSSIASIEYNIELTNNFILYIGLASLAIGMVLTYFLSRRFTKPILAINEKTKKIKELDFSQKINYKGNDEIGELSNSINEMADSLSEKINGLQELNSELLSETKKNRILLEKKRQLLSDISHDLKTPLSLIQGYSEALKLNVNSSKEQADSYCDVISEEIKKINLLVEQLLNVNRSNPKDDTEEKSVFEVNEFLEFEIKKYQKLIDEKNIDLTYKKCKQIKVVAYKSLVDRVFTNYMVNAIRYVDSNLKISISAKVLKKTIRVSFYNSTSDVNSENSSKLWDAFYMIDESRNRKLGGHGLGLSIVKNIQETQGLKYGLKIEKDGVTFWFDIEKFSD